MHESLDQEIRTLQSIFWSERDPDGLAFASLADAFRRKGEVREALDLLIDGMSRHPDYATGHVIATKLYRDQGMDFEAELAARRVLELDPENLVGLSTLAAVLAEKGEVGEAGRHRTLLMSVDPQSDEARAAEGLALEVVDTDAGGASDAGVTDAAEITELVPETMYRAGSPDSLLDDVTLEEPGDGGLLEEVAGEELSRAMDSLGLLGEDEVEGIDDPVGTGDDAPVPGPEMEFADLDALVSDDPAGDSEGATFGGAIDLAALEPDEPEAIDLAALAPDEPEAMDLAALASDEPEAIDLAALAPDEPEVMDLAALAPDEPEAIDLAALAPDEPEAIDLAALAPDEPEVMDLAALAPDEPVDDESEAVDLAALAPESAVEELTEAVTEEPLEQAAPEMNDEPAEPIYTRTLADLYIKQGFDDKALEVLKALQARNPDDANLADRIATLEGGGTPEIVLPERKIEGDGHSEDDVETRARELAEHGQDGAEDVDTPFAWNTSQEDSDEGTSGDDFPAGNYFDALLAWENRAES